MADARISGLALAVALGAGLFLGVKLGMAGWGQPRETAAGTVAHLAVELPPDAPLWLEPGSASPSFALSPDGTIIAYTCARADGTQLCLRRMDRSDVSPIAGSEGARHPAFSPNGQSVVFCVHSSPAGPCDSLKRVSVTDGRVDALGTAPEGDILTTLEWTPSGTILLTGSLGIWQMPEAGGPATPIIRGDPTTQNFAFAASLPGDRQLIFSALTHSFGKATQDVRVVTVASGEQRVLLQNASMARYLPTGHLFYMQGDPGVPMVAAFDHVRLAFGTPVPLWETVRSIGAFPALVLSRTGTLLYLPSAPDRVLAWVDPQRGAVESLPLRGLWQAVRLSPDGKQAAVERERERIAVIDLDRRIATDIAFGAVNPLWTPDGRRVALDRRRSVVAVVRWKRFTRDAVPVDTGHATENDGSWSPDGRALAFTTFSKDGPEIRILSKHGAEWKDQPFLPQGYAPRFSPNGRWLAYESMWESPDIGSALWVRAYPGGDRRTKVSVAGGHDAIWSADGRELFYRDGDRFLRCASKPESDVFSRFG